MSLLDDLGLAIMNSQEDAKKYAAYVADKKASVAKVSWTDRNVANDVRDHLLNIIPEAFKVPGVWVSGSNVWRFLYGDLPEPGSDIDCFVEGETYNERRARVQQLVDACQAEYDRDTHPSRIVGGEGAKYKAKDGRSIDVWKVQDVDGGDLNPVDMLRSYPEASHAQARAAYNCEHGYLLVIPNTKAP